MSYQIFWSPNARNDFVNILEYLNKHWGQQGVLYFIDRTEKVLQLISDNLLLFISSEKKPSVHRCVVVKQISFFYRINNNKIELLRFWDNRMDPEKLTY